MDAEWSVELGADDPSLELPWVDPDTKVAYRDIKRSPQLIDAIPEAVTYPPLRKALAALNETTSPFETAKCDVWATDELDEEDAFYSLPWKFGGYIDLVFTDNRRFAFAAHENFARDVVRVLRNLPETDAKAELIIRRLFEHECEADAYYITLYVFGFGEHEPAAQDAWAKALPEVIATVLRQAVSGASS